MADRPADARDWLLRPSYAHRGLHGDVLPENTMAAFEAALDAGHGIECDVRRSKDGRAVIFHDEQLGRLTGHSGNVHEHSVGELTQMRVGKSNQTIPTLLDLLRLAGSGTGSQTGSGAPLLIELKTEPERSVVTLCRAVRADLEGYLGPVAVMSYDLRVAEWFAQKSPEILRGLVVRAQDARTLGAVMRRARFMRRARPDFLACDIRDQPDPFATKHQAKGLPILTWTVRTKDHIATARSCNAAPIFEGEVATRELGKADA